MKVVNIHHPHSVLEKSSTPLAMALGFFDGVHRGHQQVIRTALKKAEEHGCASAVMTFDPHPSIVLAKNQKQIQYITPLQDKINLIDTMGVDYLFVIRFTSAFASLEPEAFIEKYVVDMNVQHVIAGFDYTFGKFGKGTMKTMIDHANGRFEVTTVEKFEEQGDKVSSTVIRQLLKEGRTLEASKLLGRFHSTMGTVIHGEKRGSTIGFPTANLKIDEGNIIPKNGVYAVRVHVSGQWKKGVCNIGYKPTFNNPDQAYLSIEVHILDFHDSIYGEEIRVEWCDRIRDEQKFNGIEELTKQISRDKEVAAKFLDSLNI